VIRGGREDVVVPSLPEGVRAGVVARLLELHRILARGRGEFGYRTGKEVMAYLRASYFLTAAGERTVWETGGWEAALDEQILQKILPKLHGSRSRLGPLLGALARYCASGSEEEAMKHYPAGGRSAVYGLQDVRALEGAKFGRSYRKLARMIEVLVEEQFVSFIC
jgi:5-methylcytosine-specific restriction protein B